MLSMNRSSRILLCLATLGAAGVAGGAYAQKCGGSGTWVPPGSTVTQEGSALRVEPPQGFVYVGYDSAHQTMVVEPVKCSCDCTSSSGNCMPGIFNGQCGCSVSGGCTSCTLTTGTAESASVALEQGGFIDREASVQLASGVDRSHPVAFSAMFDLPEVQEAVARFLGGFPEVYKGSLPNTNARFTIPDGYSAVPLTIFGRSAFIVVPRSAAPQGVTEPAGGSCSCTAGSCTYKSRWTPMGTLHYCEGNCTGTCTLELATITGEPVFSASKAAH